MFKVVLVNKLTKNSGRELSYPYDSVLNECHLEVNNKLLFDDILLSKVESIRQTN